MWQSALRQERGTLHSEINVGVLGQRRECLGSAHVHFKEDRCDFSGWSRSECRERELLCALN